MKELMDNIDINQYLPAVVEGTTNVLFAIIILLVGVFIANRANKIINKIG